ncbi:hypothetical protein [Microbulbifer sediminum]|uniref:hypothetical protein n=1 Tax=Microbulbifer sediminum TaxID=2904250 RepID=UPI001F26E8B5|nr:hypothetical protein [Microbulbifer sediminum]
MHKVTGAGRRAMVEMPVPQFRHGAYICLIDPVDPGGTVDQPGDRGGVAKVGGELAVGVVEEIPLAGQSPYLGGQGRVVDQESVPDFPVGVGLDLVQAETVATAQFQVETQL